MTLNTPDGRSQRDYPVLFTTERAESQTAAGGPSVAVDGMRIIDGQNYLQLVGVTTNDTHAVTDAGAAVYTVLSGSFDRLPESR